jgi:hypothetical protein
MAWNGSGAFSRTNGTHTGSTVWTQDKDAGTKIVSNRHDTHDQDLADGINACIAKNGENAMTAAFDLNGQNIELDADADTKIGATADDRIDVTVSGSITERIGHDSTNSSAFHLVAPAALTAQANTAYAHVNVAPAGAVTVPSGTTAVVSSLEINEPNITATGTVTAAASLYVSAAPTEGTSNYALWVDAGNACFDADVIVSGDITSVSNADVDINPHGTGNVVLKTDLVSVGGGSEVGHISSNGAYDMKISSNSDTNSGSIVITDAANGAITLAPNGTGVVDIQGSMNSSISTTGKALVLGF